MWLLLLGIRVEIIAPGKPHQNGRLERFHRTLEEETASPPARDLRAQQRAFDPWRREYNHERPHDALLLRTPAAVYKPSTRHYPRPLLKPELDPFSHVARIDKNGSITWNRRPLFISSALKHEYVQIEPADERRWSVSWGAILLGHLDEHRPERGLITPRRRRGAKEVSAMSLL